MSHPSFRSYDEFWLFYLREHSRASNRWLHIVGTSLAIAALIAAFVSREWRLLIAVPIVGYGLAWIGHFFVEKNKPASFQHPGWSFVSDVRMWALFLTGRLAGEIERAEAGELL